MKGLQVSFLLIMMRLISAKASSCNVFRSKYGSYLKGHVIKTSLVSGLQQCIKSCLQGVCKSSNFHFAKKTCELNDADRFDHPDDLVQREGFSYSGWKHKVVVPASCAEIKASNPESVSGYHTVSVRGKLRKVYCDMEHFGGGWTLVVSVSGNDNNHLQTKEHNCESPDLCVKYSTSNLPSRKLSDQDIIALASNEGTFRVDMLGSNLATNFFQLPNGKSGFSSSCHADECSRIIISYHHPYIWESNCKGIEVGYKIRHHVFDSHDHGNECGTEWKGSLYSTARILYGYKLIGGSTGIYSKKDGLVFVK